MTGNQCTGLSCATNESFDAQASSAITEAENSETWPDGPATYPKGGLLFYSNNKDVLVHLLANGFRGKVKRTYFDPPFDSGADYARKVQLRGAAAMVGKFSLKLRPVLPNDLLRSAAIWLYILCQKTSFQLSLCLQKGL